MPLKLGEPLPSFDGATDWITRDESPSHGPTLVHFWSVSCYLCKQNFPVLARWKTEFSPLGLKVIAVHMPRQPEDTNIALVQDAIREFKITEPCAIDNNHLVKEAFKNDQSWVPAYFLFDAEGKLKSRAAGEAGVSIIDGVLRRMFEVNQASTNLQ